MGATDIILGLLNRSCEVEILPPHPQFDYFSTVCAYCEAGIVSWSNDDEHDPNEFRAQPEPHRPDCYFRRAIEYLWDQGITLEL